MSPWYRHSERVLFMEASMLTNQTLAGGPVLKGTHTLKYNNVWRTSRDEERSQANYFYVFFVFFNETLLTHNVYSTQQAASPSCTFTSMGCTMCITRQRILLILTSVSLMSEICAIHHCRKLHLVWHRVLRWQSKRIREALIHRICPVKDISCVLISSLMPQSKHKTQEVFIILCFNRKLQ